MAVIISIIVVMFLVLILYMWNSLGNIENSKKIIFMFVGVAIIYIFTFIIFNISKIGIDYSNKDAMIAIRRIFVIVFSIVNAYVVLPYIFKKINQINNKELDKEKAQKSLIIILIIIVFLAIFETIYLGNMQKDMIDKYDANIQTEIK